jgi:hypothetical protein
MRHRAAIVIAGSILLVSGCRSHSLSREKAGELVSRSNQFNAAATREIILGPDLRGKLGMLSDNPTKFDYDLADCLEVTGYLSRDKGEFALTEKGQTAEKAWGKDPRRPMVRVIPVAHANFIEVSGVSQAEAAVEANAEFKWQWSWFPIMNGMDNSEIGAGCQATMGGEFGFHYAEQPPTFETNTGKAKFRRFDDGWRLEWLSLK